MKSFCIIVTIILLVSCHSREQNNRPGKPAAARKNAHVYIPAEFPGGQSGLLRYFRANVPCIDSVKVYGEHFAAPLPDELRFKIDTLGRVIDLGIINATALSQNKQLHDRCIDAIQSMRWYPATNDGKKIVSHVWITFRLKN